MRLNAERLHSATSTFKNSMSLKKSASISRLEQLARAIAGVDPNTSQFQPIKSSVSASGGNVGTATNAVVTVAYAAAGSGVSHVITGVKVSYTGGSLAGGNVKVKDGATAVLDLDISAAGQETITFNPPLKGSPNTAMSVVLAAGGAGLVGKINVLGHYTEA
jgi:hypothetical protein